MGGRGRRWLAATLAVVAIAALLALGVWQVERLAWKRALIAQVDRRLAAAPVAAPVPADWPRIGRDDAYTRLRVTGRYRVRADTFVQAVTDLGGGFWVVTPLVTDGGWAVLVNRGFVPADRRAALPPPPAAAVTVTGLLRVTEPGGGFLRHNDPVADRWYSRDVAAIARKRGIQPVAPYFIDADAPADGARDGWPRAGLTLVRFPNNHLVYAITWFALAGLVTWLLVRAIRRRDAA